MTKYEHGIASWVDLSTTDMEAAAAWYGDLFGWSAVPQETHGGPPYTQFMLRDKTIAGMGKQSAQLTAAGVPPTWNTLRFNVLADPQGGTFTLFQAASVAPPPLGLDPMSD